MLALPLLALAMLQGVQLQETPKKLVAPSVTVAFQDPRTPIDAQHTPGDANSVYQITSPGSYYLPGNLTAEEGKSVIEIASSGVTIDLMGFTIVGVAGAISGIREVGTRSGIHIRDGNIISFGEHAIDLSKASGVRLERIVASNNAGHGIVLGNFAHVSDSLFHDNGGNGITVQASARISNCHATANSGAGIHSLQYGLVSRSLAAQNGDGGIRMELGGTVLACEARSNSGDGIEVASSAQVKDCFSVFNSQHGISAQTFARIEGCTASDNGFSGIIAFTRSHLVRNTSNHNGTLTDHAGIRVTGWYNHVEDNSSFNNHYAGYIIEGQRNFVQRNIASTNALNWAIFDNNIALVINSSMAGVVLGEGGGSSPGSEDPTANYTL